MQVKPNQNTGSISPVSIHRAEVRRVQPAAEQVNLEGATAVNRTLEATPQVRPEVVDRARQLLGAPTYPPRETIVRLSHLLAMNLPPE